MLQALSATWQWQPDSRPPPDAIKQLNEQLTDKQRVSVFRNSLIELFTAPWLNPAQLPKPSLQLHSAVLEQLMLWSLAEDDNHPVKNIWQDYQECCNDFAELMDRRHQALATSRQAWTDCYHRLSTHFILPETPSKPLKLSWQQRLRHPLLSYQCQQQASALLEAQAIAQYPVTEHEWAELSDCDNRLQSWYRSNWQRVIQPPGPLDNSERLILGILLFTAPNHSPTATLQQWLQQPPWQQKADLATQMAHTQWEKWAFKVDADNQPTQRVHIAEWLDHLTHLVTQSTSLQWDELALQPDINDDVPPTLYALDQALSAFATGDDSKLRDLLERAWLQTLEQAQQLSPWFDDRAYLTAVKTPKKSVSLSAGYGPQTLINELDLDTLASLIFGDIKAHAQQRFKQQLNAAVPSWQADATLPTLLSALQQRMSWCLNHAAGLGRVNDLSEQLLHWQQRALQRHLEQPEHDPATLSQILEQSRIALTGLSLPPPDEDWLNALDTLLGQSLQRNRPIGDDDIPQPWPTLCDWHTAVKDYIPEPLDWQSAQHQIQPGEALVQLFFSPLDGCLQMLWLTDTGTLEPIVYTDIQYQHWRKMLNAWQGVSAGNDMSAFATLWQTLAEAHDNGISLVCDRLRDLASQHQLSHLILLLPAELAILPWDAWLAAGDSALTVERAISLRHLRTAPASVQGKTHVIYGTAHDHIQLGLAQVYYAQNYWKGSMQSLQDTHSAGVLQALQGRGGHLIMHAYYAAHDPRLSALQLAQGERLLAWVIAAVGVGSGSVWHLSACQTQRSGATGQPLLGPVGIGPLMIAAGARRVIGPLWKSHQVSDYLFYQQLYQYAQQHPKKRWSQALSATQSWLRELPREQALALIGAACQQQHQTFRPNKFSCFHLRSQYPFKNPFYWAPFALIGADDVISTAC